MGLLKSHNEDTSYKILHIHKMLWSNQSLFGLHLSLEIKIYQCIEKLVRERDRDRERTYTLEN